MNIEEGSGTSDQDHVAETNVVPPFLFGAGKFGSNFRVDRKNGPQVEAKDDASAKGDD
ncbi:hypothetical protein PQR64_24060 [Paraburkholderia phytofirmans]|jgi:hypothetical protein|uniref:hypothetical protein n=1 Tax=Paraburkholderia phytofirmans TaxID=261302 RepID=UPI0038BA9B03